MCVHRDNELRDVKIAQPKSAAHTFAHIARRLILIVFTFNVIPDEYTHMPTCVCVCRARKALVLFSFSPIAHTMPAAARESTHAENDVWER